MTWTAPATPADSYLRLTISVDSWVNGLFLNPVNGHRYVLSPVVLDWAPARDAAASLVHDGLQGYLTTVSSSSENAFVTTANGGATSWIGATTEIAYVNPLPTGSAPVRPAAPAAPGAELAETGLNVAPLAVPAALPMLIGAALLLRSRSRMHVRRY